jgi:2-oxoglutarate dehydrogenase E2 component (dihydrolipoamide succinyltransferase)
MAQIELLLPKMGESVAEATIIKWLVEEGQAVEADDPIVEIATDKVDSEVPSPEDGVLVKKMVNDGDVVEVGQVIAIISTDGDAAAAPSAPAASSAPAPAAAAPATPAPEVVAAVSAPLDVAVGKTGPSGRFYSPLVRSIAKEEGIPMVELESISGSGQEGRVTKKDILGYIAERKNGASAKAQPSTSAPAQPSTSANAQPSTSTQPQAAAPAAAKPAAKSNVVVGPNDEIVEMDRMRKLIADHMVMSKHTSPHVTSFVEADVTNIVNWRNKNKKSFEQNEGEKLTFTPIFMEAVVKAIKDFPGVNASVDGTNVILRKDINIGMAAALPSGNLIVPVIKNADQLNMVGLAKKVNDLANRARTNKLTPDEISGGTFTLTNVGTFGNVMGTPIINQPQVAILAVGAIRKRPAVLETPQGDVIAIRHMMFLSHSYDHRVVDGMLGGSFVRRVADYLEAFDPERQIG